MFEVSERKMGVLVVLSPPHAKRLPRIGTSQTQKAEPCIREGFDQVLYLGISTDCGELEINELQDRLVTQLRNAKRT